MKLLKKHKKSAFKNTFKDCLFSFWANCFSLGRATVKELIIGYFMWKVLPYLLLYFAEPTIVFDENKYTELSQFPQMLGDLWGDTYASASIFQRVVMMYTNKSGWNMALFLIPVFGQLVLLWILLKKGQPTENKFGKPRI